MTKKWQRQWRRRKKLAQSLEKLTLKDDELAKQKEVSAANQKEKEVLEKERDEAREVAKIMVDLNVSMKQTL